MRPITVSVTGVGSSQPIPIDQYQSPANIALGVVVQGTITFQVQHTYDDVFAPSYNPASGTWFNHPTLTGSANADSNYAFPPRAVRLTNTAGTGVSTLTLVQAGASG
jgi:hypothetical protein